MSSKISHLMLAFAAMGMMMPSEYGTPNRIRELSQDEINHINSVRKKKALERKKKAGLKEWNINGIEVVALNLRNAIRKANNIKTLLATMV